MLFKHQKEPKEDRAQKKVRDFITKYADHDSDFWVITYFSNRHFNAAKKVFKLKPSKVDYPILPKGGYKGVDLYFNKQLVSMYYPAEFYYSKVRELPILVQRGPKRFSLLAPYILEDN